MISDALLSTRLLIYNSLGLWCCASLISFKTLQRYIYYSRDISLFICSVILKHFHFPVVNTPPLLPALRLYHQQEDTFIECLLNAYLGTRGCGWVEIHSILSTHSFQWHPSVQFSSVARSCPTVCNPMNRSTPGLPVHHQLPEFTQTHVHWVGDAIQPSHPLSSPSPLAPNPSQHQSLFQWVNSLHEVAKVLEFQL